MAKKEKYIPCNTLVKSIIIRYSYLMFEIVTTTCPFCLLQVYQLSHVPTYTQNSINTYYMYTL